MNKFYWAVFSGKLMLPFTIRTTKKQCIADHERDYGRAMKDHESVKKVKIEVYKP